MIASTWSFPAAGCAGVEICRAASGADLPPDPPGRSEANGFDAAIPGDQLHVIVINDSDLMLEPLAALIVDSCPDIRVSAYRTVEAARAAAQRADVLLSGVNGASLTEPAGRNALLDLVDSFPDTPVMIIAQHEDPGEALLAIELGAHGYFPDTLSVQLLIAGLRLIMAGDIFLPGSIIERLVAGSATRSD